MRGKNRIGWGIGVVGVGTGILVSTPAFPAWLVLFIAVGGVAVIAGVILVINGAVVLARDYAAREDKPQSAPPPGTDAGAQWKRERAAPGIVTFTNVGRPTDLHFIRPWSSYSTVDTDFSLPIRLDTGAEITVRYSAPEADRIKLQWRTPPNGQFEHHSFSVPATDGH